MNEPGREAEQRELISRWVRDHGPSVLGYLTALVRDVHRAEDLLQDVFCRAWEARHRYMDQGREIIDRHIAELLGTADELGF